MTAMENACENCGALREADGAPVVSRQYVTIARQKVTGERYEIEAALCLSCARSRLFSPSVSRFKKYAVRSAG